MATGSYVDNTAAKLRLGITDASQDSLLTAITAEVNDYVEGFCGRVVADLGSVTYTFDGSDALEGGRMLPLIMGFRSVTTLQVAASTGATLSTVPSTDYFLRPTTQQRDPGWPATELWMTDIPTSGNATPIFYRGFNNVAITGSAGWAAVPGDLADVALKMAVATYRERQSSGGGDVMTINVDGSRTFERALSYSDRQTLLRYRVRTPSLI